MKILKKIGWFLFGWLVLGFLINLVVVLISGQSYGIGSVLGFMVGIYLAIKK